MRWILMAVALVALPAMPSNADPRGPSSPTRVLITNDNGIEDDKLVALARAFDAAGFDTWVVAPADDQSGTSNSTPATRRGGYEVRPIDIAPDIHAFALRGSPADCVIFALAGPMADARPDIVVSGVNGGANSGPGWFGSGTVGAARTAAFLGLRAIAVSGLSDASENTKAQANQWIVALAESPALEALRAPEYLTVAFPPGPVTGVAVRGRSRVRPRATIAPTEADGPWTGWVLTGVSAEPVATPDGDRPALLEGRVVVTPMNVDEVDHAAVATGLAGLPDWSQDQ